MRVRATQVCFIDGNRRRVGEEFDYSGKPAAFLTVLDEAEGKAPEIDSVLTDDELRVRLAEYGVKIAPQTGRKKMISLLAEAEGKAPEE